MVVLASLLTGAAGDSVSLYFVIKFSGGGCQNPGSQWVLRKSLQFEGDVITLTFHGLHGVICV